MEWVETTGKTIEQALDRALDQLGVDESDLEYEVLVEPRAGLFGLRRSEARIRARVKPLSREKPGQGRSRGRGRSNRDGSRTEGRGRSGSRGQSGSKESRTRPKKQRDGGGAKSGNRRRRPDRSGAPEHDRRERTGRGKGEQKHAASEGKTVDDEISVDEQSEMAVEFAQGLVDAFGADAEVTSTLEDDENVLVEVTGDELGLLVGPRGATLAAVEELVRTVVQRGTAGGSARIHVDVGGYRAKRREALAEFATQVATTVLDTGDDKALEAMSAADRKVVHDVIAEIDGVDTVSEGEEPRRRVVIRRG